MRCIKQYENLSGKKYNRLLVIEQDEDYVSPKGHRERKWKCKCDCRNPNLISVRERYLKSGHTKSCGCLQKDVAKANFIKRNIYNLDGDCGICYLSNGTEVKFDKEDYDLIKDWTWYDNGTGYITSSVMENRVSKRIYLHDLVMGCYDEDKKYKYTGEYVIDHMNHDTFDNRKENLRKVTISQNIMNSKLQSNNTSGYSGISFDKKKNAWQVYITKNKYRVPSIYVDDFNEAIELRRKAEEKYFGEYSYERSINHGKG